MRFSWQTHSKCNFQEDQLVFWMFFFLLFVSLVEWGCRNPPKCSWARLTSRWRGEDVPAGVHIYHIFIITCFVTKNSSFGQVTNKLWHMGRPRKDLDRLFTVLSLLEVFDDWDIPFLWVKTIHDQTTVSSQRYLQTLQPGLPLVLVPIISEVDGNSPPGQSQLRGRAKSQVRGQFAFNRGSTLELIVDLNTHTSPSLFEFCWDVSCPLCSMSSDLSYLQGEQQRGK